jgi:hypothetical protein
VSNGYLKNVQATEFQLEAPSYNPDNLLFELNVRLFAFDK